jgi:hypothetical protein
MIKMYKPQKLSVIYHIITSYITIVIGFIPTYRATKSHASRRSRWLAIPQELLSEIHALGRQLSMKTAELEAKKQ